MNTNQLDELGPANLSVADRIDLICDAFERALLGGQSPRIEDFLDQSDAALRERLLPELLLVDREFRIKQGAPATREDYRQRFPAYSSVIDTLEFETIDDRVNAPSQATRWRFAGRLGGKLAQFELLEEIGSGASGTVWKAQDTRLRRLVAIKIPRQEKLTDVEHDRFLREGQACAQLRHPNIVAVYEVGEQRGCAYIISELIDGMNLRDWLRKRRPRPQEAAELAAQLAEALHHAHEQNIIHRDLKPANVLIDRDERPHITDFGLAKWTTDTAHFTVEGNILGTPAYMSPEQARGETSQVDRRSDVYGLGALLYEMLSGCAPFKGDLASIVHQVIHDEPQSTRKINTLIPRDLDTICQKAMEKDAARRYPTAQEMAVDLRRFARGEPILARRINPLAKGWRWVRRRPAIAAAVMLAFITFGSLALASRFATKNHELLGLRTISITTDPPGAKVAFVPLSKTTGEPQVASAVYARGTTPVEIELAPGDYFVVAVLPDGRFHEVFRHVPDTDEHMPWTESHRYWTRGLHDEISLPQITIPSRDAINGMALIEGSENFRMGVPGSTMLPVHLVCVSSFYVDTIEFTYGDYRRIKGHPSHAADANGKNDEYAMSVTFDNAVMYAEYVGKRLPTEVEFEFMATSYGRCEYPWGDILPNDEGKPEFGPVKIPSFDRLASKPPVFGLCSNVAEWTTTSALPYRPRVAPRGLATMEDGRIFRGGSSATIEGDARITPSSRNPRQRADSARYLRKPGLGFRCVRSATPLISFDQMP